MIVLPGIELWAFSFFQFSSVEFICPVMSDSLQPHDSQQARPPCPSPTPRVYPNSLPSSQWCHPAISSSVVLSPPAPNPFQHQGLFQWVNSSRGGQSIEVSFSISPSNEMNTLGWTGRISLQSKGLSFIRYFKYVISLPLASMVFAKMSSPFLKESPLYRTIISLLLLSRFFLCLWILKALLQEVSVWISCDFPF